MEVLAVVPGDNPVDPRPGGGEVGEGRLRVARAYFSVRKMASAKGLSSLTLGRLKEAMTPRRCKLASIVEPFHRAAVVGVQDQVVRRYALALAGPLHDLPAFGFKLAHGMVRFRFGLKNLSKILDSS